MTMRTAIIAAIIAMMAVVGFASPASARKGKPSPDVAGLKEGHRALKQAIDILSVPELKRRPDVRAALKKLSLARLRMKEGIREVKALRRSIRRRVDGLPPRGKLLPRGPLPMEYGAFDELIGSLKKVAFGADRQNMLNDARKRHYFTTRQVRKVMTVFDLGAEKVKAAASLYPRVVDKQNFFKVYPDLEFESERKALRKKVKGWDTIGLPPLKRVP